MFTSDCSFNFMKGTRHLSVTNVVNSSFIGDDGVIILSDRCSTII